MRWPCTHERQYGIIVCHGLQVERTRIGEGGASSKGGGGLGRRGSVVGAARHHEHEEPQQQLKRPGLWDRPTASTPTVTLESTFRQPIRR